MNIHWNEWSLIGLGLTYWKLQYIGHLTQRADSLKKDPDAGKDWVQGEKGTAEDEKVEWYHQHNGHESKQTAGDSEEQGSLVSCSPRGHKELRHNSATEQKQQSQVIISGNMTFFFLVFSETDLSIQCNLDYLRTC